MDETVIVERAGKPEAVLLSVGAYDRLRASREAAKGLDALKRARALRDAIRTRRAGAPVPAPEDVIAEMRGERDDELTRLR